MDEETRYIWTLIKKASSDGSGAMLHPQISPSHWNLYDLWRKLSALSFHTVIKISEIHQYDDP